MPAGANQKREREYQKLVHQFRHDQRYQGREEEVAARIVNKQRSQYGETREERKKDQEGQSPDRNLPIGDFQGKTIAQIAAGLDSLPHADLKKIRAYEIKHKNRKGLLAILDRRLKKT